MNRNFLFIEDEEIIKGFFVLKNVAIKNIKKELKSLIKNGRMKKINKNLKNHHNKYKETLFHNYFEEKGKIGNCHLIKNEFILYEPMSLFKREFSLINNEIPKKGKCIGKIDVLFRNKRKLYGGEIKWNLPRNDFWSAMKILGYCVYFNWQNEAWGSDDYASPAILIPIKHIALEHKLIANKLKISLFGIEKLKNGEYTLENINPF